MVNEQPTTVQRLLKVLAVNPQRKFGSYAAELSFYIIWAVVPLLLAIANVIAVLPFSSDQIVSVINDAMPAEVSDVIVPILENYIASTSVKALSLGLIISLWPASNVFNAVQRILNTIFKAKPRKNALISRGFAYVFTLALVVLIFSLTLVFVFGETILNYLTSTFDIEIPFVGAILQNSGLIGLLSLFILMFSIYQFMPNVNWSPKYASVGAIVALIGFGLISQLFTVYLSFNKNIDSNSAIGIFIVVIIWLYYNMMVISLGAYAAVLYHDYCERDYLEMVAETTEVEKFQARSPHFKTYQAAKTVAPLKITKQTIQEEG